MKNLLSGMMLMAGFLFPVASHSETVCGKIMGDEPEVSANFDEYRRFSIVDKNGAVHSVLAEIDPDVIRGAPLRTIRAAKKNNLEICVTGAETLDTENPQILAKTVDGNDEKGIGLDEPVARVPAAEKTLKK